MGNQIALSWSFSTTVQTNLLTKHFFKLAMTRPTGKPSHDRAMEENLYTVYVVQERCIKQQSSYW